MKRMKETSDDTYENSTMTAQTLRDNTAKFCKDNSLLNLITVRDGNDVEPEEVDIRATEPVRSQENVEENENEEEIIENINGEEEEETRIMRLRFQKILQTLKASTKENIEGWERLMKQKNGVAKAEIDRANKILEKHLGNTNNICTVIDAVYAMGQTIEERKGVKRNEKRKENKNQEGSPNRRIRKLEKQIKELRQILAWTSNEIHRRKVKWKSTKKEKEILQKLKKWADQQLNRNEELICVKEKALDKLRYCNIKMKRLKIKDARIRNNKMFQEDQEMFSRKTQGTKQLKGNVPRMEKCEEFWAGIWENNTKTPKRKWMNTVAKKMGQKVANVQEFTITEKKLHQTVKKRKNWSAPGIDGVQNFWWKKFRGAWSAILRCFNQWLELPDKIPD